MSGLLIGTVIFFLVVMALAMGIPFYIFLQKDIENERRAHRH